MSEVAPCAFCKGEGWMVYVPPVSHWDGPQVCVRAVKEKCPVCNGTGKDQRGLRR